MTHGAPLPPPEGRPPAAVAAVASEPPAGWRVGDTVLIDAEAGGHREGADPVAHAAVARGDEIGEAEVGAPRRLVGLLAQEMQAHAEVAVLGDFNIAPEDRDVYDPVAWAGQRRRRELRIGRVELVVRDARWTGADAVPFADSAW